MTDRRTLILGFAAAAGLGARAFAAGAFQPLFDGKSLDGWIPVGGAQWRVEDGAMVADAGAMGYLLSKDSYGDFELRVEVWVSPEANSGIFIRCSDPANITAATAYEVNIYDTRPDPAYGTGAIVDVAKVSPMPKAGGRWSVMEISARGDVLSVAFNGQKTVEAARDSTHARGPIALQYGAGIVKFRKVEIRPL